MLNYPKVEHKLPELFDRIIEVDNLYTELKTDKVVDIILYKETKTTRNQLITAGDKYIQRQKGTGNDN